MKPLPVQMELVKKRITALYTNANMPDDTLRMLLSEFLEQIKEAYNSGMSNCNYKRETVEAIASDLATRANAPTELENQIRQLFDYHIRWANCTGLIDAIDPRLQSVRPELLQLVDKLDIHSCKVVN